MKIAFAFFLLILTMTSYSYATTVSKNNSKDLSSEKASKDFNPEEEEDYFFVSQFESTPHCSLNGNWRLVDTPAFTINVNSQNQRMLTPETYRSPAPPTLAETQQNESLQPFVAYPLSLFVAKGPESPNGSGGKVFASGGAIYSVNGSNLLTAPLRHTNNYGNNTQSWSNAVYSPGSFPAQTSCPSGTYCSETGSLGIRVIDGASQRTISFQEDNVYRETNGSPYTLQKVADLNTTFGNTLGSSRILITDAYYSRDFTLKKVFAVGVAQVGGRYIGVLFASTNNGTSWTLENQIDTAPARNTWITSITMDLKALGASPSNPLIVIAGYTNNVSGNLDSTWFVARKFLNSSQWTYIENSITRGRYSSVNRILLTEDSKLVVAGQLTPSSSNSAREGLLRVYDLGTQTSSTTYTLSDGQFYDVGFADDDNMVMASGTSNSQPIAVKSSNNGFNWSQLGGTIPQFTSGWAYEMAADHKGDIYWILQDEESWKTYKLDCD